MFTPNPSLGLLRLRVSAAAMVEPITGNVYDAGVVLVYQHAAVVMHGDGTSTTYKGNRHLLLVGASSPNVN